MIEIYETNQKHNLKLMIASFAYSPRDKSFSNGTSPYTCQQPRI